jgi:amidase
MIDFETNNMHYFSMNQLKKLYEDNEISPLEVTNYMFERIDKHDSELKSFATLMIQNAIKSAEDLSGKPKNLFGPLHGIPIAVKDLCYTKGVRTMGGTEVLENFIPKFDSTVVKKLRDAGAIILGKLNTTEGAMGGYNPKRLAPRNPWDIEKWSGSSSSGSGVATAAGLCFGSLGSDTGGSIRYPSAACGVVGLKPTYGRVSRYGVLDLAKSLDHVGPMTRTVKDTWDMYSVIKGFDEMDLTTINDLDDNNPEAININEIKIGYDDDYASQDVNPEITNAIRKVVKIFESLNLSIEEVKMPDVRQFLSYWPILCSSEAALAHAENYPSKKNQYGKWFAEWLQKGCDVSKAEYIEASIKRDESNNLISNSLKNVDVLIAPTLIDFPHYVDDKIHYGSIDKNRKKDTGKFTIPFNYNRYPTLTLPCGFSKSGLPIGLQIIGKPMTEAMICALGVKYEQITDWHNKHPENYN